MHFLLSRWTEKLDSQFLFAIISNSSRCDAVISSFYGEIGSVFRKTVAKFRVLSVCLLKLNIQLLYLVIGWNQSAWFFAYIVVSIELNYKSFWNIFSSIKVSVKKNVLVSEDNSRISFFFGGQFNLQYAFLFQIILFRFSLYMYGEINWQFWKHARFHTANFPQKEEIIPLGNVNRQYFLGKISQTWWYQQYLVRSITPAALNRKVWRQC